MDMTKRVICGSVTVRGWPVWICRMNNGTTEPRLAMMFPYRVQQMTVRRPATRDLATAIFSISALDIPIALIG
jgi:hypothetical protein